MMSRQMGASVAIILSACTAAAQQPGAVTPERHSGTAGGNEMSMKMDSSNHRLDSLVDRMNRASGDQKMQTMAAVINELVTQRKTMQGHMHRMMKDRGMAAPTDSMPADTTNHAAHHPPQ